MAAVPAVEDDLEFQAQGASEAQIAETVQRATEYYQQRKCVLQTDSRASEQEAPIHAQTSDLATGSFTKEPESERSEPYPASFAAIVELLTTGREDEIPGIREIPLKIHDQPPSESKMTCPRKPWE
ncbi:hypothetical protein MCAP1_002832 [Malassezia caprae]|uniref:Peroxisomal membrane protein PEX14-like KPWE domain-containing protein n=1 Tax=Malassezia caprae TaxID=1381934 RepID=A0AAF0EA17_9BASI|nr:hypothetical protein MCAP1_002832 [Malassezia caprae]